MELTFHLIEDDADNTVTVSFLDCQGILGYADRGPSARVNGSFY